MKGVLFLCVANSARSQMAEGLARSVLPADVAVFSAGSNPGKLNPFAVQALAEVGIDIAAHWSKAIADVPSEAIDTVVTLCAEQVCPIYPGHVARLHWPLPDPASAEGGDTAKLAAFRAVRDDLRGRIAELGRRHREG